MTSWTSWPSRRRVSVMVVPATPRILGAGGGLEREATVGAGLLLGREGLEHLLAGGAAEQANARTGDRQRTTAARSSATRLHAPWRCHPD
jgi:hypothetical protein